MIKLILNHELGRQLLNDTSNQYNHTPLTCAIQCGGNLDTVKLLIKEGADYNKKGDGNKTMGS